MSYKISSEIEELAVKSAEAVGTEICGVDIIEGSEGPVVIEVNIAMGMKICHTTGMDIPKKIAYYVSGRGMEGKRIRKLSYFFEKELERIPRVIKDIVKGKD